MATTLHLKNDFDVLQVWLHPFFFARFVSTALFTASLRRPVRKAGELDESEFFASGTPPTWKILPSGPEEMTITAEFNST
jgi:hypothetical protein